MIEKETTETNGLAAAIAAQEAEKTAAPETVALDDVTLALLNEQAAAFAHQRNGTLTLFIRQRGLQGQWNIGPDGRTLVRAG
jgi:hypothetical protein